MAEKDEEIDNARRNAARSVEQIQASLDNEMRARGEAIRSRKKMESDFNDLEVGFYIKSFCQFQNFYPTLFFRSTWQLLNDFVMMLKSKLRTSL